MAILNEDFPMALYYQLKEIFIEKIEKKEWPLDEKIPTERELCDLYNVSRITVRKAIEELEKKGYIYRKQGKGTFVKSPQIEQRLTEFYSFSEEIRKMGMKTSMKILDFIIIESDENISSRLNINKGESVYSIKRLRLANDDTFALETSYIPCSLCPGLTSEDILLNGLYNALKIKYNIIPNEAVETFEAVLINKNDTAYLNIKNGQPGIKLERITKAGDKLVEYCESIIRGDRYKYRVVLK